MDINLFEYATRNHIRLTSARGSLTVEDLWEVPLRSKDGFDLNAVAKAANKALKDLSEESFVETKKTPEHTKREVALECVKHVIGVRLAEEEAAKRRDENKQKKEQLLAILAEKQASKYLLSVPAMLSALLEKELQKQIAALDDDAPGA